MNAYFEMLQKQANESIEVFSKLPDGHWIIREHWGYKEANHDMDHSLKIINFYFCDCCNGWIKGYPKQIWVNDINPFALAGRQGYSVKCERCNYELTFHGRVS